MMKPFVTLKDISLLFRDLSSLEERKASALLEVVSDSLRQEAKKVGKNLDEMKKMAKCMKMQLNQLQLTLSQEI